jgi:hypothetical protein
VQEFFKSKEYAEIMKQVNTDYEFISVYAFSFMSEVNTTNPSIQGELSLDTVTSKFNSIYKE